jgi:hypothetical protein
VNNFFREKTGARFLNRFQVENLGAGRELDLLSCFDEKGFANTLTNN